MHCDCNATDLLTRANHTFAQNGRYSSAAC
jgi:hypothetical protein